MFDFQELDPGLLHLLSAIVRFITNIFTEAGDPDETEVEPNP